MPSFLIFGKNAAIRLAHSKKLATQHSSGVDLIIFDNPTGIDSAREVKAAVTRRPYQSKAISIILSEADYLTIEAQNALLKILEEPPGQTYIYITVHNVEKLLPTVRSRTQTINLGRGESEITSNDLTQCWKMYVEANLLKLFESEIKLNVLAELMRQILKFQLGGAKLLRDTPDPTILNIVDEAVLKKVTAAIKTSDLTNFLKLAQDIELYKNSNVNRKLAHENLILALPLPSSDS